MKLTTFLYRSRYGKPPRQWLLVMKLTVLICLAGFMSVSAATLAQKVTLDATNANLKTVLKELKKQSGYDFVVDEQVLDHAKPVTLHLSNTDINAALDQLFSDEDLAYSIEDKVVTVKDKQPGLLDKLRSALNLDKIDVHGRVVGDDGLPLSGATVIVKGTSNSTSTDAKGEFNLKNVDPGTTVVVTFVGYEKQEIKAGKEMGIIKMVQASNPLDAVQVIAYGQTTERLGVGNVSTVDAATIVKQPVSNPLLALEGEVPGLFVQQQGGMPGSGVKIYVQGYNSILNGNDPLFVVDGVPYPATMLPNLGYFLPTSGNSTSTAPTFGSPFNYINPEDIESISVLKDADATSIYGSRAANGAILITTRKGKAGPMKITVNTDEGLGKIDNHSALMNTPQYIAMREQALRNDGISSPGASDYDINGTWNKNSYTDWQKVLIGGTDHYTDINGTVSGGNDLAQYLIGGTYRRETTVMPGDFADQKGDLHFSFSSSSGNHKFHMQLSGSYNVDNNHLPNADLAGNAQLYAPDAPAVFNADGSLNWAPTASGSSTWTNPEAVLTSQYLNKTNNLVSHAVLSYTFLPGLQLLSSLGYNNIQTNETVTTPLSTILPEYRQFALPSAQYTDNNINTWIIEPQLSYDKLFKKNHLKILLGGTLTATNSKGEQYTGSGYNSDQVLGDIGSAATVTAATTALSEYRYAAVFGKAGYSFNDELLFDASLRRDGSSRFGQDSQFQDFWSAGAGWIFSKEDAVQRAVPALSFGKLKVSYGTTGNDQIGNYQYLDLYKVYTVQVPYQGGTGILSTGLANPFLQWETTRKLNAGLNLGFFQDRILVNVDYFRNRSTNQLLPEPLPAIDGFTTVLVNIPATIQNSGWELQLNTVNFRGDHFKWTTGFNLTVPRNKLLSFPDLASSSYSGTLAIGESITSFKVYHYLGVDPATGRYEFADNQGNPTTSPNYLTDRTSVEDLSPKFYGGLTNSFSYRDFTLSFLLQFKKTLGLNPYLSNIFPGWFNKNAPADYVTWQSPGQVAAYQRLSTGFGVFGGSLSAGQSDAAYIDASFIRLQNLALAWQVPGPWIKGTGIQSVRLSLDAQNLFVLSKYPELDPEGQSFNALPPLRMFALGLHLTL